MNEIKALDKLRLFMNDQFVENGKTWRKGAEIINEMEDEIAAYYLELPKDADGIPIHVGDEMWQGNEPIGTVTGVGFHGEERVWVLQPGKHVSVSFIASGIRHFKSDMLVKLLEDFARKLIYDYPHIGGLIDETAERIRDLCCQNADKQPLQSDSVSDGVYAVCDK